jgi:hypothetical protein
MVNKHQLLQANEHVEALNLADMLLLYLSDLNHFLMGKIHLHDVLPKQQMFYFKKASLQFCDSELIYFENGKTSNTNFSSLTPLIWDGLLTCIPLASTAGIFFLAT